MSDELAACSLAIINNNLQINWIICFLICIYCHPLYPYRRAHIDKNTSYTLTLFSTECQFLHMHIWYLKQMNLSNSAKYWHFRQLS